VDVAGGGGRRGGRRGVLGARIGVGHGCRRRRGGGGGEIADGELCWFGSVRRGGDCTDAGEEGLRHSGNGFPLLGRA
jgi:hypothetical protein